MRTGALLRRRQLRMGLFQQGHLRHEPPQIGGLRQDGQRPRANTPRMTSSPRQPADHRLCELREFVELIFRNAVHDVPVDGLVVVHRDVAKTDGFLEPIGQRLAQAPWSASRCEGAVSCMANSRVATP